MNKISFYSSRPADVGLVCLTNDSFENIAQFVSTHKKLGYAEITVYFDGISSPGFKRTVADIGAKVVDMGLQFLIRGLRLIEDKQFFVFKQAYEQCRRTWLAVCDIDEFLIADEPLSEFLDKVPSDIRLIRAVSHETVWRQGEDPKPYSARLARSPIEPDEYQKLADRLYGTHAHIYEPQGMLAHKAGKYLVRTGLEATLQNHHVLPRQSFDRKTHKKRMRVLHFDAISETGWLAKSRSSSRKRFKFGPARRHLFETMRTTSVDEGSDLFRRLYFLDDQQIEILAGIHAVHQISNDWKTAQTTDLPSNSPQQEVFSGSANDRKFLRFPA